MVSVPFEKLSNAPLRKRASASERAASASGGSTCPKADASADDAVEISVGAKAKGAVEMLGGAVLAVAGVPLCVLPGPGVAAIAGGVALASKGQRDFSGRAATPVEEKLDAAAGKLGAIAKEQASRAAGAVAAKAPEVAGSMARTAVREAPRIAGCAVNVAAAGAGALTGALGSVAKAAGEAARKKGDERRMKATQKRYYTM